MVVAKGINKVILIGNVGSDPEIRHATTGATIANVSIATSEGWKDKQTGESKERTEWHRIVFFNKLAEIVGQYVKKGSKIYVEGALRTRQWEQDGIKRYSTEVVASEMQLVSRTDQQDFGKPTQPVSSVRTATPSFIDETTSNSNKKDDFDTAFDIDFNSNSNWKEPPF